MASVASETGDDKVTINEQRAKRRREMARSADDVRSRLVRLKTGTRLSIWNGSICLPTPASTLPTRSPFSP